MKALFQHAHIDKFCWIKILRDRTLGLVARRGDQPQNKKQCRHCRGCSERIHHALPLNTRDEHLIEGFGNRSVQGEGRRDLSRF